MIALQQQQQSQQTTTINARKRLRAEDCAMPPLLLLLQAQEEAEIDAIVRLQSERLRAGLEEAGRRHWGVVALAAERQVRQRLREKEAELAAAMGRNAELEERARRLAAEGRMWLDAARSSEAVAVGLRARLEEALACEQGGESVDEASCCYDGGEAERERGGGDGGRRCRACGEGEVGVLLLPCRHLCLCKGCESKVDTCPICGSSRDASLQVFLE